ncbi:MAG: hypothetical protein VB095_00500 [Anaerovorax sp.]|nr:hypothetical protein [Anaerovorax sp.]
MESAIIVAIIVTIGNIIVQLLIAWNGQKSTEEIINYRIGALEKKVDKHNHLVERMTAVEQSTKCAHHRIDELRRGVNNNEN